MIGFILSWSLFIFVRKAGSIGEPVIDSEVDADTKEESGRSGDHTERNDKPGPLTVVAKRNRVSDQSTILVVHSTSRVISAFSVQLSKINSRHWCHIQRKLGDYVIVRTCLLGLYQKYTKYY